MSVDVDVGFLGSNAFWTCRKIQTSLQPTEDGESMFLRNTGIYLQAHTAIQPRGPTNTDIFTAVRISVLKMNRNRVLWDDSLIALMMEAASTFETSVNFYQSTRRNIPEDSNLHSRCENLNLTRFWGYSTNLFF
jgi:hypothetical protein